MTEEEIGDASASFIRNVKYAIGQTPAREVAHRAGMKEGRLQAILEGKTVPNLADIRALEIALNADLWPWPHQ